MSNTSIQFDKNTQKFFYVDSKGKRRASPDVGYIAAMFARENENHFKNNGTFEVEVSGSEHAVPVVAEFDINQRFQFIENYVNLVADRIQPSMIITGPGGLGKSHTVVNTLLKAGYTDISNVESLVEGQVLPINRFKVIKGFSTPKAMYRTLFENKNSIVIFDDCDAVLRHADAINVIKSAADTTDERIVSWNSEGAFGSGDDLPKSFRFEGSIIFISNLSKEQIPQAIRTRSICIDVSMTTDQKIQRMEMIATSDSFMPEVDTSIKTAALDAIREYKDVANDISMRSLVQLVRIGMKYSGEQFSNLAKYSLTN